MGGNLSLAEDKLIYELQEVESIGVFRWDARCTRVLSRLLQEVTRGCRGLVEDGSPHESMVKSTQRTMPTRHGVGAWETQNKGLSW